MSRNTTKLNRIMLGEEEVEVSSELLVVGYLVLLLVVRPSVYSPFLSQPQGSLGVRISENNKLNRLTRDLVG